MKLTDIALHSLSTRRNLHLQRLSDGLNIVLGPVSTFRDLTGGIAELLFGAGNASPVGNISDTSYLAIQSGGVHYRLQRKGQVSSFPAAATLVVTDSATGHASHRQPDWLSSIDRPFWESIFDVSIGTGLSTDNSSLLDMLATAAERRQRLEVLQREAESLRMQREELVAIDSLSARTRESRQALASLDQEIARLASWIEEEARKTRSIPAPPPGFDFLEVCYARLDDLEMQLRRWRAVQNEVQQQRLKLKDELTSANELAIESREHPCHDAREILIALENKLNRTDNLARSWEKAASPALNKQELSTLCQEMRSDLGALCSELARQYRHVRHRAAVAELKQLRRCYHDMEESIQRLVARRVEIVAEIRNVDPAGAAAIERHEVSFAACAENEGYFAARQRFVTQHLPGQLPITSVPQTVHAELATERQRLADWNRQRNALADEIASMERELAARESRRGELARLRCESQPASFADISGLIASLDLRLASLESERSALEIRVRDDARYLDWNPDYLMTDSCRFLEKLTGGKWTRMGVSSGRLVLVGANGAAHPEHDVSAADRSMARLALRLAAIGQMALRGVRLPLLITDLRQDDTGSLLYETLDAFCRHGHQVILFTGSPVIARTARQNGQAVYELADADLVTPVWHSDPLIAGQDVFPSSSVASILPPVPWSLAPERFGKPAAGPFAQSARGPAASGVAVSRLPRSEFPAVPVVTSKATPAGAETPLAETDVVESIYLNSLDSFGVRTTRELIELDLDACASELVRRGFTIDQVSRWQSQALLLIAVPDMSPSIARVLVACGIEDPDMLDEAGIPALSERIRRHLESPSGRGVVVTAAEFSPFQLRSWAERIRAGSSWRGFRRPKGTRRTGHAGPAAPFMPRVTTPPASRRDEPFQFFLQLSDKLETAPSIGPKSAIKFEEIGIQTVGDFLAAEPATIAARLANRRMSANVIKSWQDQSRLVCCVPNLRGHDAQLLVGCKITDVEQLARMDPQELLSLVLPYSRSKEGERIIRHGKRPDLQEVTQWIEAAARHSRPIRAA